MFVNVFVYVRTSLDCFVKNKPLVSLGYVSPLEPEDVDLSVLFAGSSLNEDRDNFDQVVTVTEVIEQIDMSLLKDIELPKLGPDNYSRWKLEIEDILNSNGLWSVVNGTSVCPINPMKVKEIEEWSRNDSKAKCVLRRTLTDVYFNHTRDCRTGKAIFDRIVELMEPKSVNVLLHSWQEFHSYTWME